MAKFQIAYNKTWKWALLAMFATALMVFAVSPALSARGGKYETISASAPGARVRWLTHKEHGLPPVGSNTQSTKLEASAAKLLINRELTLQEPQLSLRVKASLRAWR